jgi:hypothetical protein
VLPEKRSFKHKVLAKVVMVVLLLPYGDSFLLHESALLSIILLLSFLASRIGLAPPLKAAGAGQVSGG